MGSIQPKRLPYAARRWTGRLGHLAAELDTIAYFHFQIIIRESGRKYFANPYGIIIKQRSGAGRHNCGDHLHSREGHSEFSQEGT